MPTAGRLWRPRERENMDKNLKGEEK